MPHLSRNRASMLPTAFAMKLAEESVMTFSVRLHSST